MWGSVKDRKSWLQKAIDFTGDAERYGTWMRAVADEWKFSCEHNLTKLDTNRRAWIGHAAVAMAMQCPEDIVREAWSFLSQEQQDKANAKADDAIAYWESIRAQNEKR